MVLIDDFFQVSLPLVVCVHPKESSGLSQKNLRRSPQPPMNPLGNVDIKLQCHWPWSSMSNCQCHFWHWRFSLHGNIESLIIKNKFTAEGRGWPYEVSWKYLGLTWPTFSGVPSGNPANFFRDSGRRPGRLPQGYRNGVTWGSLSWVLEPTEEVPQVTPRYPRESSPAHP